MITSGLLFSCVYRSHLSTLIETGFGEGILLYPRLEHARRSCSECIIAVDALAVDIPTNCSTECTFSPPIPPEALMNADPFREPVPVDAAGGILVRRGAAGPDVLLIYRRGVWDLPKGKRDPGESIESCARREVCEEVGIDAVEVLRPLGQTVHGYADGRRYAVKTTHWFLMSTPETSFTPQRNEDIEDLEWIPWGEARDKLGFEILRLHLQRVSGEVKLEGLNPK